MNSRPAALLGEVGSNRLGFTHVRGLKSLRSTDDIELEPLAFGQRLEALALDRGVVNEHVLATLLLDETKTLRFVEPLHRSVCHLQTPSTNRGIAPTQRPRGRTARPLWSSLRTTNRPDTTKPQATSPAALIPNPRTTQQPPGNCLLGVSVKTRRITTKILDLVLLFTRYEVADSKIAQAAGPLADAHPRP